MRIVTFHNTCHVGSAWACAEGIPNTLRQLGHDVIDGGHPRDASISIDILQAADAILLGAPEWYLQDLHQAYGDRWNSLRATKAAWYAESFSRDDKEFDFSECRHIFNLHYFPAHQDAQRLAGIWLPFAADDSIFFDWRATRDIRAGFLGSMYPKRIEYVKRVGPSLNILPQTGGSGSLESVNALVKSYNRIQVLVNLPSYSRLIVTKVTEAMACGAMVLTPKVDHPSGTANMDQFRHGEDLVYYDPNNPEGLGETISFYINNPEEMRRIAATGASTIRSRHTLKIRMIEILTDIDAKRRSVSSTNN